MIFTSFYFASLHFYTLHYNLGLEGGKGLIRPSPFTPL